MNLRLAALVCMLIIWACVSFSGNPAKTSAFTTQDVVSQQDGDLLNAVNQEIIPPAKKRKLIAWLKAGTYKKQFTPEPAVHPSLGPHGGNVRTYYNPILTQDLRAGKTQWRSGAAMVKELYLSSNDQVRGFSVMVKVNDESGPNAEGWVFFENFDLNNSSSGFYGRGVGVCANCHRGGTDYLLSEFRP